MKFLTRLIFFSLIFTTFPLSRQSFAQTATATQVVAEPLAFGLQDGTPVKLRLARNLSSADAKTGETIDFEVLEDIKIDKMVIIPRGGIAIGTVTRAKPKGRMGKAGKLDITIDFARTVTGEKIALRAVKEMSGKGSTGAMTGAIVASSILFFPAAPFFLFMKGKDTKLPKGTEVAAYVNGDASLDRSKFLAPEQTANQIIGPNNSELSSISVKSDPDGAEITIDGKFVGSSPSTLSLKPGDYTISISKAGHALWERKMSLNAGGNITVDAKLDKLP